MKKKIKEIYGKFVDFYKENDDCLFVTLVTGTVIYFIGVNKGSRICKKAVEHAFKTAVKNGYGLVKIIN